MPHPRASSSALTGQRCRLLKKLSVLGGTTHVASVGSLPTPGVKSHHNSLLHHYRKGDTGKMSRNILGSHHWPLKMCQACPQTQTTLNVAGQELTAGHFSIPYVSFPEVGLKEPKL